MSWRCMIELFIWVGIQRVLMGGICDLSVKRCTMHARQWRPGKPRNLIKPTVQVVRVLVGAQEHDRYMYVYNVTATLPNGHREERVGSYYIRPRRSIVLQRRPVARLCLIINYSYHFPSFLLPSPTKSRTCDVQCSACTT